MGVALGEETPPARKVVYLTFDDGPCNSTLKLLEILREEGVPATFFLIGNELQNHPEAVRAIVEDGHAIGGHSYYHQRSLMQTPDGFRREMARFNRALWEVLGFPLEVRLFRFPFGSSNTTAEVRHYASEAGYLWIDWNASNYDTDKKVNSKADQMLAAAIRTSRNKDEVVMLMHENRGRTRDMLPALIQYYRNNGYEFDVLTADMDYIIPGVKMGLPAKP
ncbi:MAG: polysaccharide deacetylase [Clostridia bacterium]|nr:polysaccharide deacetylase [Clostridia bacterium]